MARKATPLTDKEIKAAKPKEKTYRLFDGGGLHLEISPKGQKWWRLKYRFDGKEKRISLGVYPATSLKEARKSTLSLKEQIARGIDPSQKRKDKKQSDKKEELKRSKTLKIVSEEYFNHIDSLEKKLSEKYRDRLYRRVKRYVYTDEAAGKPIDEIQRKDVLRIVKKLVDAENFEVARRVLISVKSILEHAADQEYVEVNVAAGIKPLKVIGKRTSKHFPLITDSKELKDLLISLDNYTGDFSTKQALRIMPYLALRPYNIRFLEWGEVDLDNKVISIAAGKMKMNAAHRIPLPSSAIKILKEMQPYSGDGKYVFPSRVHKDRPVSENTLNLGLRRLGYTGDQIVSHSFRGIFSTLAHKHMKDHKCSSLVIEEQLSHKDRNESRESYNHNDYFDERVELMEWWSNYLDEVRK